MIRTDKIEDIYNMIDCCLVELQDDGFVVEKTNHLNIIDILIKNNDLFKLSDIQTKVLTLIDYLNIANSCLISYQTLGPRTDRVLHKVYPLFMFSKIKKFKISIKLIKNTK